VKVVLYFVERPKGLVLNKTNLGLIAGMFGPETVAWNGQAVQLYTELVNYQGRMVPGIRIRAAQQPPPAPPTAQPQPAPGPAPTQQPSVAAAQQTPPAAMQPKQTPPPQPQSEVAPWEMADRQQQGPQQ
jgi:hypothetical protein